MTGRADGIDPEDPSHAAAPETEGLPASDEADPLLDEIVRRLAPPPAESPWEPAVLAVENRFRIGAQLGNGGVGVVFRAHDTVLGREVALKLLREREPATIARFVREARAQARIEHENVCRIYDVGELAGAPFIAMQLVVGDTLERVYGRMSIEQ